MGNASRDDNYVPTLIAVSNVDGTTPVTLYADPTTHRLLVSSSSGSLENLSDVTITSAAQGDILYYDGSDWVNLAAGDSGKFLKTQGAGANPIWDTVSAAAGGSDTQVQFNDGGSTIGGDAGFTYNKTTDVATVGGVLVSGLTASEIVITDGSKNLTSATVATYPSLTELTYVKGVTSAIQTQLNAKGDVSKVGTPANNQIGVWTGDGTIEGTSDFTFDGSDLIFYDATNDGNPEVRLGGADAEELHIQTVFDSGAQTLDYVLFQTDAASATADKGEYRFNVDGTLSATIDDGGIEIKASGSLSFGAVDILTDSAGTTTLRNIDSIDANTEGTIESAIDTLANLTSIQGRTITLADAGADAIFGWDDSANAYENLTQAEVLAVIGNAAADGSTKGVATFTAADFNASSGNISIDYANGQKATTGQAGFITELATTTETNTGTDTVRAVTPDGLSSAVKSIMLTAAGGAPLTTAGCSEPTKVEAATNDINYYVLDFDASTEEHAFWSFTMPENWDAGTLNATFYWTNAGGGSTETVVWGIAGGCWADDAAIDAALGTEITTTDTWIAQGDMHISAESSAITFANAAAGAWTNVVVARKVASDNLTGDARLIAVKLTYTIDQYSDEI